MTAPPKVSVLITTYKHEKFIAQAIESALMQQTDFPFEVVIGEDKSPDDTRKLVEEYQQRHPNKIRLFARERNLSSGNFVETYAACRGKYVAILEGDDYWTSPDKLQIQADALDAHREWVLCFHTVRVMREDGSQPPSLFPQGRKEVSTLDDLLRGNFIQTCSVMFRNGVMQKFPDWYAALALGDWPFFIMLAQHGQLGYLDRTMADYRVHGAGLWASKDQLFRMERSLEMLGQIRQILDGGRRARLTDQIVNDYIELADEQLKGGYVSKARSTLWGLLRRESVLRRGFPHRKALRAALEIEAPRVLRLIRWIRQ
jgi:glycosyltransferase involved in cell wall biosynthesis